MEKLLFLVAYHFFNIFFFCFIHDVFWPYFPTLEINNGVEKIQRKTIDSYFVPIIIDDLKQMRRPKQQQKHWAPIVMAVFSSGGGEGNWELKVLTSFPRISMA